MEKYLPLSPEATSQRGLRYLLLGSWTTTDLAQNLEAFHACLPACGKGNDSKGKLLPTARPVITLSVNDLTNFRMLWRLMSIYRVF